MTATWDMESTGRTGKTKIVVKQSGDNQEFWIDGTKTVGDALREICREIHLSAVNVYKEGSGIEVAPSEAHSLLSAVGNLEVIPKAQGA